MTQLGLCVGEEDLFIFETTMSVMVNHLNYGNNLAHESVMTLLQEARMQYLTQEGMTETSLEGDVGFLIANAQVNYHSQAFYGDELRIQIYSPRFKPRSRTFGFNYQVIRVSDGQVIADAQTKHVFFNKSSQKVTTAPAPFYWMIHRNLQLISTRAA